MVSLKGYNWNLALEFIADNANYLGGQALYTCTVSLQHLMQTGRLDNFEHNLIKNMDGAKLFTLIKRLAFKKGNEMFSYNQYHFETEWQMFFNKKLKSKIA